MQDKGSWVILSKAALSKAVVSLNGTIGLGYMFSSNISVSILIFRFLLQSKIRTELS